MSGASPGFDEVFCGLLPRLYRRAVMLAGSRQSAEDVVHEAYLKLAARPKRFLAHPEPYAYAFTTVLNVARDAYRKDRRQVLVDAVEGVEEAGPGGVSGGVAAAVAAVALGVWWLVRPGPVEVRPTGPPPTVPVKVYNSESACRTGRTLECALRLAKDPHTKYAARDNSAGRVWHGEVLAARCVVTDGQLVRDEQGVTSTRWYLVSRADGVAGWLPGVRTRNTREVPVCPDGVN
ncbi:RNA polymerase sigma factor [Streptomyces halobius]|uniref:RNA polymerase sigma factor n=1 Tax=Streptomyces halobius TaxID=2879846 RepID=A0ABY4MBK0_9ACTN|nr:RNA polymerase sigma factor [Streptomyces halobius]UQA94762.1 RNA polymerase sigma factor [Streptomyces halobius]